ncbi:MAG TPA: copper-binding protein [Rhodocyclaceae bacterium]|jgi:Cu/Ag efflux protein CusF
MERKYYWTIGTICALLLAFNGYAQESQNHSPQGSANSETKIAEEKAPWTTGEVRKVEIAQKRITVKHGAIPNLGMDPMTMIFRVKDAKAIEGLRPGSRIQFKAVEIADVLYITELKPLP